MWERRGGLSGLCTQTRTNLRSVPSSEPGPTCCQEPLNPSLPEGASPPCALDGWAHTVLPLGILPGSVSTEHHKESPFPSTPKVSFSPRKAKITPSINQACCSFSKAHVHGAGISSGLPPHAEPPTQCSCGPLAAQEAMTQPERPTEL